MAVAWVRQAAIGAVCAALLSVAAAAPGPQLVQSKPAVQVDTELVLAVDVSYSMDPDEQALQREGYPRADLARIPQRAAQGANGKIAITYVEWAGKRPKDHHAVAADRRSGSGRCGRRRDRARAVPARLAHLDFRRAAFSKPLFETSGYRGLRRVIDVSATAPTTRASGRAMRDEVLAAGITINGLPIMLNRPNVGTHGYRDLDVYYEDCVIGGPGAFVVPIREREKFIEATRPKLVLEIAGVTPAPRVGPALCQRRASPAPSARRCGGDRWGGYDYR